jgi:hypothetical protein
VQDDNQRCKGLAKLPKMEKCDVCCANSIHMANKPNRTGVRESMGPLRLGLVVHFPLGYVAKNKSPVFYAFYAWWM